MLAVLELKKRNSPPLLSSPLNDAQLMSFFREIVAKKAAWAFARANLDLRAPAKKRKRSLEGHVPAKTLAACEKVPPSTVESSTAPPRVGAQPFCLQAL